MIKHFYKDYKILKISTCGMIMYKVKNMPNDFYTKFWNGTFHTLKDAKKYIDKYELELLNTERSRT